MKIVFATDDGLTFMDRHFGDAEFYEVFEVSKDDFKPVKRIINSTEEDDDDPHGDIVKAKGVSGLFKDEDIKVLVSKVFGPNIKRMKKKFVCVLINSDTLANGIKKVQEIMPKIEQEWKLGEARNFINLKKNN